MTLEYNENQTISEMKLVNKINKEVGYYFYTKPYYWTIEEENKIVELFAQKKENPETYQGKKVKKKMHLATYCGSPKEMYKEQKRLLKNYLHNVGGEIIGIKEKNYKYESDIIIYYEVPKDAPYSKDVKEQMEKLIHQFDFITQRVILRKKYGKKLPEIREEEYYIQIQNLDIWQENLISLIIVFISLVILV